MVSKEDEWWWCKSEALFSISKSLENSYVSVVDNFLTQSEFISIHDEVFHYQTYSSFL